MVVVEILGADVVPREANLSKKNGTVTNINSEQAVEEPIKSILVDSSHDETCPTEAENLTKDIVDEETAGKQIHNFYFVRFRLYEDPKLKEKLEEAHQDIYWKNQFRFQIIEALRSKRSESAKLISRLMSVTNGSLPTKGAIEDQLIGSHMDVVRKDQQTVRTKIKHMEKELESITNEITSMEEQLDIITNKRTEAYKTYNDLTQLLDEANALFYENRSVLNLARDLAANKNIAALKKLSNSEGEKFMSQYSRSKDFRDDYKRRILSSLHRRQLSGDGRQRNTDEKTIVEEQPHNELEATPAKITLNPTEISLASLHDTVSTQKVQDEIPKPTKVESREKPGHEENIDDSEIGESKELPKLNETNEAMLKEIKREEEIAKAKLAKERNRKLAEKAEAKAMLKEIKREEEIAKAKLAKERNRKLAEKAEAKAAARAQKDAEKKIKEKEKHVRKAELSETYTNSEEQKESAKKVEVPVQAGTKEKKEKVRYRGRTKVPAPIPKAILKRKKSPSYWSWVIHTTLILALGFILYLAITDIGYRR